MALHSEFHRLVSYRSPGINLAVNQYGKVRIEYTRTGWNVMNFYGKKRRILALLIMSSTLQFYVPAAVASNQNFLQKCSAALRGLLSRDTPRSVKPTDQISNESTAAPNVPLNPFFELTTKELGFESDFEATKLVEKAFRDYTSSHPEVPLNQVDMHALHVGTDVEKKIGWRRFQRAYFQALANRPPHHYQAMTPDVEGLIYYPHPSDHQSVVIYGTCDITQNPIDILTQANGGKSVVLRDILRISDDSKPGQPATRFQFRATVRPYADNQELKTGEILLTPQPYTMNSETGFLVEPFQVGGETIGLSRIVLGGGYVLRVQWGYRSETRGHLGQTLLPEDLRSAVFAATQDSGFFAKQVEMKKYGEGTWAIFFNNTVPSEVRLKFEQELIKRIRELKDFKTARISRLSPIREGTDHARATAAEQSGFSSLDDAVKALNLEKVDGSPYFDEHRSWQPFHPTLTSEGNFISLQVDAELISLNLFKWGYPALKEAKNSPMTAVPLPNQSGYLVNFSRINKEKIGNYRVFHRIAVFATRERSEEFIRTHRYFIDDSEWYPK